MQYILMLYVNEAGWPKLTPAEQAQGMAAYVAYTEALQKAGVLKSTNRLQPSSAAGPRPSRRVTPGESRSPKPSAPWSPKWSKYPAPAQPASRWSAWPAPSIAAALSTLIL